jgi:nucleotide-binding universal stress UspA family protein
MKILVCTDGSEHSQKALEKAALIAGGCSVDEVAIISVYENIPYISETYSKEAIERQMQLKEEEKREREKILQNALKYMEDKGIKARTIFKEGHPAETIVEVGCGEGFDFIVMGSRGLGGLKKALLGSVSNAVVQQADKCSVIIVR